MIMGLKLVETLAIIPFHTETSVLSRPQSVGGCDIDEGICPRGGEE